MHLYQVSAVLHDRIGMEMNGRTVQRGFLQWCHWNANLHKYSVFYDEHYSQKFANLTRS